MEMYSYAPGLAKFRLVLLGLTVKTMASHSKVRSVFRVLVVLSTSDVDVPDFVVRRLRKSRSCTSDFIRESSRNDQREVDLDEKLLLLVQA